MNKVRAFKVLLGVEDVDDDSLGIVLANKALNMYREYGSYYGWALSYLTISKYYLQNDQPEVALDSAMKAVDLALTDRKRDPGKHGEPWEWAAKIHEFMSIVYGSLGDKESSDRHRNRYLDILEQTRQDRMYEQRRDVLEKDETELRWLLTAVYIAGGVVLVLAIIVIVIAIVLIPHVSRQGCARRASVSSAQRDTPRSRASSVTPRVQGFLRLLCSTQINPNPWITIVANPSLRGDRQWPRIIPVHTAWQRTAPSRYAHTPRRNWP